MEQINFYLKTKLRLISQWVMVLLFSLLAHNAGASSIGGSWDLSGGQSIYNMSNPRYRFTLDIPGEVDIRLDNKTNVCQADPYLYLLDSNGKQYDYNDDRNYDLYDIGFSHCTTNSRITRHLPKGEYQLVAATYLPNQSADFVFSVSGLGVKNLALVIPETLRSIKQPFLKVADKWEDSAGQEKDYENNPSYTFRVLKPGTIDIRLENETKKCEADPYLYLLDKNGNQIDYNDDWRYDPYDKDMTSNCITNSRITRNLPVGVYQLMAATYSPHQSGDFVLSLNADIGVLSSVTKIRTGYWGVPLSGGREPQSAGNPRFDFRLLEPGLVSIDLISSDTDTYLYLLDSNGNLHKDNDDGGDNTNSHLKVFLPAGTYSLVAATYYQQQQGYFKLSATLEGQQGGFYWLKDGSALDSAQVQFIRIDNKPQPIEIQAEPSYSAFIKDYIVSDQPQQPQANDMGWKEINNWWWHFPDNKIDYVRAQVNHNFRAIPVDKTIYVHLKDSDGGIKSYPIELIYKNRFSISGLSINNHASFTNNRKVNLQFEVTGNSSIASYLIEEIGSNDQVINHSGWTAYSGAAGTHSISYRLVGDDGKVKLRLKLRDKEGYESRSVPSKWITLDTQPPVISLNGNASVSIIQGQAYSDAGATASDNIDGDISLKIAETNLVNTSKLGIYKITYNVTDTAGNIAQQVTRTVTVLPSDTTLPVITLLGEPVVTIPLHQPYVDAGATATDNIDGDISFNIQSDYQDSVNINLEGSYKVTYKVTDTSGNSAKKTRTVKVVWEKHFIDTLSGAGVIKLDWSHLQAIMDSKNYDMATIYYSTQSFIGLPLDSYWANITDGGSESFRPSDKLISWTISGLKADTKYYVAILLHSGSGLELLARGDDKVKLPRLNDTGVTWGNNYPDGVNDDCSGETIEQQDCFHGRDNLEQRGALKKIGGGVAGFDFTRLNQDGSEYTGSGDYSQEPWACVRDNVTGLVWEVKTTDKGVHDKDNLYRWGGKTTMVTEATRTKWNEILFNDWDELLDDSNNTMLCGINNWRVPTAIELFNIINKGDNELPDIDTNYFPNTDGEAKILRFWTSNANPNHSRAMSVDFFAGSILRSFMQTQEESPYHKFRVRLVANTLSTIKYTEETQEGVITETPDNRYKSHSDGTVTDKQTGLMWQRCSLGQTWDGTTCTGDVGFYKWQDALKEAQGNNFANYTDWRLPNTDELVSLVAFDRHRPAINLTVFPGNPDGSVKAKNRKDGEWDSYEYSYWSSTVTRTFYYHPDDKEAVGAWVTEALGGHTYRDIFKLSPAVNDAWHFHSHDNNEHIYNVRLVRSPRSGE